MPFTCPQCFQQVFLSVPPLVPMEGGYLAVNADPMIRGLGIHMRVGCTSG